MSNETIIYSPDNKPPNLGSDKFYDNDFPPNDESIFGFNRKKDSKDLKERKKWELELKQFFDMKKGEKFQWERIFSSNVLTLSKKPNEATVIQGTIGDCYFISYLHAIKERCPEIYSSLIRNTDIERGYMEFNFFNRNEKGKIEEVIVYVDDYIPCFNGCPIFSRHENVKIKFDKYFDYDIDKKMFEKIYVGSYMLLEKAFAKLNGSYYNIIGGNLNVIDPIFSLTGIKYGEIYFRNIFVDNSNDNIKNKYKNNNEIVEKLLKELKGKTDKEKENIIKKIETERQKEKEQIIKELKKEDKEKIMGFFQSLLKKNICTVGSEIKYSSGEMTKFGIYACHCYDLRNIQTEQSKSGNHETFIYLWNPHGNNPNPEEIYYPFYSSSQNHGYIQSLYISTKNYIWPSKGYYKYEDFDNINAYNKKGFKDGNIILNSDRFFYAFKRIIFHDENEAKAIYDKIRLRKNILKLFIEDEFSRNLFLKMYGIHFYIFFIIYLIQTTKNKSIDKSQIFKQAKSNVKKVIVEDNDDKNQIKLDEYLDEKNGYIEIKENLKNEILSKANEIMKEKCKSNFKENDLNNITKILINENEQKNEKYKLLVEENDIEFLNEINQEIKSKAIKFAQNFNTDKSELKQEYLEQINFSNSPKVDNQVPYFKNGTIVIRSSLGNKNLHIQHNEIKSETPLILFDAHGGDAQRFFLVNNNDGTVSFEKDDFFAIEIKSSLMSNRTIIQLNKINYENNQKFILKKREDDLVSIHSYIDQNYVIDVFWANTDNFTQIQLWNWNNTNAQKFKIIYV